MQGIFIIEDKDKRFSALRYQVGYCKVKMGYVYFSGFVSGRKEASFTLFDEKIGYVLSESDFSKLGVIIPQKFYGALCNMVREGLHEELFEIIDNYYKK